jgi:hypothetical protein
MGLLDDAIREHLELKRKHGADPEDVDRQEREALGPGQRNEFAQPDAAPADVAASADEPATTVMSPEPAAEPQPEPEPAAEPDPEPEAESAPAEDALPDGEPGVPEEPTAEHPAAAPGYDEDPWLDDEPDEVPSDEALESRPAPPSGEEDVLEETPEFLQETPEHDRLWFEQKPPRDFDWDK